MKNDKNKINKKDFVLVQQDKEIHDLKFETKPTTYFKDAMRRFVKNKSSVAASVIIGILVLLAIFVPIFNKSIIKGSQSEYKFLPPRWPGFAESSILNGSQEFRNIVADMSDPENPLPVGFIPEAIEGEVKTYPDVTNTSNIYASGGTVKISSDTHLNDFYWQSADVAVAGLSGAAIDYELTIDVPEDLNTVDYFEVYVLLNYSHLEEAVYVPVILENNEYGIFTSSISAAVVDVLPDEVAKNVTLNFGIKLPKPIEGERRQELYINSFLINNLLNEDDDVFDEYHFDDANELMLRRRSENLKHALTFSIVDGSIGRVSLLNATIYRANFRYNPYEAVFGNKVRRMGKTDFDKYAEGFFTYTETEYVGEDGNTYLDVELTITDDRSVVVGVEKGYKRVTKVGKREMVVYEYDVVISGYRELGLDAIPYYIFGTNQMGHDYFKVIFSGLRTSLILGVSAAAINILIGLVWGAISGYYGGTVDLVMERFTEILGGVPWIIIMTLAILHLGNSFEVFLLALILTGWIGVAATTRSQFYRYKRREYVLASRTLGAGDGRLIFKHILPNSVGPIVTGAVLMIPGIIFSEATISYLGLGLQGLHSMGVALSEVQEYIYTSPYLIVTGSIVIALLLISFNLFGNGLRDAFNPSLKGSE